MSYQFDTSFSISVFVKIRHTKQRIQTLTNFVSSYLRIKQRNINVSHVDLEIVLNRSTNSPEIVQGNAKGREKLAKLFLSKRRALEDTNSSTTPVLASIIYHLLYAVLLLEEHPFPSESLVADRLDRLGWKEAKGKER